ncbi:gelsolin-like [Hyposmocoma kahamanoa]|uniref:gelsolin-like n=1 Tax=Hyposmocoma kahamanoa TaxID=1477025 RepID=UPI000E6D8BC9|nr:gelsolin-like [Hyposmocoma kahamanoa]
MRIRFLTVIQDLDQHDSFVLDAGEELYIWIGKETSQQLRKSPIDIATAFTNKYKHDSVPVVVTKQGLESDAFIRLFEDWDPDMWQKNKIDNQSKEDAMELNEV